MRNTLSILFNLSFILFNLSSYVLHAQNPKLSVPIGHTDKITVVAFRPDGKIVATGSNDRSIKLWNANTGHLLVSLEGHTKEIEHLEFNTTGERLLTTAATDTVVKLWDAQTGKLIKDFSNKYFIKFANFSPDGKMFMVSNTASEPTLYNSITGLPAVVLKDASNDIESVSFSKDGRLIATVPSSYRGYLEIFDTETGVLINRFKANSTIDFVKFSPNDNFIITRTIYNNLILWDTKTGKEMFVYKVSDYIPQKLVFSPDGKKLITYNHQNFHLWSLENGKLITKMNLNNAVKIINTISFTPDGSSFFTTGSELTFWDSNTGKVKTENSDAARGFAQFNPVGNKYLTNQKMHGKLRVLIKSPVMLDSTVVLQDAEPLANSLDYAVFNKDGSKVLMLAEKNHNAIIWNTNNGIKLAELKGSTNSMKSAYLSPTKNFIVTENQGRALLWSISNNLIGPINTPINRDLLLLRYSNDGKTLVTVKSMEQKNAVGLWNTEAFKAIKQNIKFPVRTLINTSVSNPILFSADSRKFLYASSYNSYLTDAATGEFKTLKVDNIQEYYTSLNPSANRLITYLNNALSIYDLDAGIKIHSFEIGLLNRAAQFLDDEHYLIFHLDKVALYSIKETKPKFVFAETGVVKINKNNRFLMIKSLNDLSVWSLQTGKLTLKHTNPKYYIRDAIWSNNDNSIFICTDEKLSEIDAATGLIKQEVASIYSAVKESENGQYLFCSYQNDIYIHNRSNLELISTLKSHTNKVLSIIELQQKDIVLTLAEDQTVKIWNVSNGKLIYTYLMLDPEYTFSVIPSGYYMANQNASKLLYYVNEKLQTIAFEQLDVKYNRPDLVLRAIGNSDSSLISSYRKAYEKRIKRLGFDTTMFTGKLNVPETDFLNRENIEYERSVDQLTLHIRGKDSTFNLDRFNLWVNEVPLFGTKGLSLKSRNKKDFDTTLTVSLSDNINVIETSVTNVGGLESYRMPLQVIYRPTKTPKEKLYFVGIGIDQFADSKYNLKYSTKDIRDLSKKLKEKYADIIIDTLFNENVTISNVKALKQKLLQTSVNDKVLISYSGHGMLSKDFDYFLSTYAVNFEKPEEKGLAYDELESLLDSIPARKKLMLIDACHSGEVDKDDLIAMNNIDSSTLKRGFKPVAYKNQGHLGLKNSFELMQSLFVNVGKSTGATIISAAAGTEFALEGVDNLPNGVFTYCILEAMQQNKTMKISELKNIVGKRVEEITKGLQKPTSRNETIAVDWTLW